MGKQHVLDENGLFGNWVKFLVSHLPKTFGEPLGGVKMLSAMKRHHVTYTTKKGTLPDGFFWMTQDVVACKNILVGG
jgi:hypothetical protein